MVVLPLKASFREWAGRGALSVWLETLIALPLSVFAILAGMIELTKPYDGYPLSLG